MLRTFLTALLLLVPAALFAADDRATAKQETSTRAEKSPDGETTSAEEASAKDSPLVRAAKNAKARRGAKTVVITDADVKSSKGKLSIISSRELPKMEGAPAETPANQPATVQVSAQKQKEDARARYERAQQEVATIERTLRTAEENYYNEDDATIRDQVIEARFDRAKKQLDKAREELASAREALQKLD
ncbi:MAG TPA: hypothetical protein VMS12_00390 [Thermoanaerobaculia bacterium]|nr:hypothetical protein [Thermoanaerobaculia bacterium]